MKRTSAIGAPLPLDRGDRVVEFAAHALLRFGAGADLVEAEQRSSDDGRRLRVTDGDRVSDLAQAGLDRGFERAVAADEAAAEEDFDGVVRQVEPLERDSGERDDLVGEVLDDSRRHRVARGLGEEDGWQLADPTVWDMGVVVRLREILWR